VSFASEELAAVTDTDWAQHCESASADLAQIKRAGEIESEIEVLFMSGYARPVLASQGRLATGVALVEKPFSEAELLAKAGLVLNGHFRGFTTGDPGSGDPGSGDPGPGDPGSGDPGPGDPGSGDPGPGNPGSGDPGPGDPGPG
jgi:hypothetical protein